MAIIERQNEQSTLDKLSAQRKLYDMAKKTTDSPICSMCCHNCLPFHCQTNIVRMS